MEEVGMILCIIFIPVGILIAICCIGAAAQRKKIDSLPDTRRAATVLSMRMDSSYGTVTLHTYYILFQLEDGSRIEYSVNSDWYNRLVPGDTGILVNRGKYFHEFVWQ